MPGHPADAGDSREVSAANPPEVQRESDVYLQNPRSPLRMRVRGQSRSPLQPASTGSVCCSVATVRSTCA